MMRHFFLILLTLSSTVFAQTRPGTWEDHLSINSCNSVTKLGTKIYASYSNGLIYFDESEISPRSLNKINGLNDVGIRLLRANAYNNKLLVIYNNCNIDVVDMNGTISNYPDFKNKTLSGRKIINEVTFDKGLAYLACGFGIVVFDTDKLEIKDTYLIGPNSSNVDVLQVAVNDNFVFASSSSGLFSGERSKDLNNYKNWMVDTTSLPKGYYCGVINVAGTVLCAYSPGQENPTIRNSDTVYQFYGNGWKKFPPMASTGNNIRKMGAPYGTLFYMFDLTGMIVRDVTDGALKEYSSTFNGQVDYGTLRDGYFSKDHTGNISYWLADNRFGLYQTYGYYPYYPQNKVTRNGTNSYLVSNIDIYDGVVAVAPSNLIVEGIGSKTREGINFLKDNEWSYMPVTDPNGNSVIDVTNVLIDRKDKSRFWLSSWYYGILLYKNNKLVSVYTTSNSAMPDMGVGEPRCAGLSMDSDGNVWFANSDLKGNLSVIKRNGTLINFPLDGKFAKHTFVDKNNFVWILHQADKGITVFKHSNFTTWVTRSITKEIGNGNLESNSVFSIAEDKDGKIWVGTAAGIRVFYNTSAIFGSGDIDGQPIKIVQDGNVELLLSKETVTSIVVDGANNKWVGTLSGGVYCFTADGITQLFHFTKENSPLYSNSIIDMNYDEKTGVVYIGTEQGIQSYKSVTVAGSENYDNVYAYPNPVRPGYQGTVLVRGLVDNSIVKITDESGNLVWETKSAGGQIEWPVRTLSGSRVTSGVYIVYASTTNGELKTLTKVLVVN